MTKQEKIIAGKKYNIDPKSILDVYTTTSHVIGNGNIQDVSNFVQVILKNYEVLTFDYVQHIDEQEWQEDIKKMGDNVTDCMTTYH